MKFIEICGGIKIPLSIDEHKLYERIREESSLSFEDLNEREQTLVQRMISRGALNYEYVNENIKLTINDLEDVWRD